MPGTLQALIHIVNVHRKKKICKSNETAKIQKFFMLIIFNVKISRSTVCFIVPLLTLLGCHGNHKGVGNLFSEPVKESGCKVTFLGENIHRPALQAEKQELAYYRSSVVKEYG